MKKLNEMLELLQELDYVPGVSMAVPDFNYTVGKRRNFDPTDSGDEFPYDEPRGSGPQNAQGDGQSGVGRGGVGWGGRPDHSGGIREPSGVYQSTWDTTDEAISEAGEQPPVYTAEAVMSGKKFSSANAEEVAAWILSSPVWTDKNLAKRKPSLQQVAASVQSIALGATAEIGPFDVKFAAPHNYNFDEAADPRFPPQVGAVWDDKRWEWLGADGKPIEQWLSPGDPGFDDQPGPHLDDPDDGKEWWLDPSDPRLKHNKIPESADFDELQRHGGDRRNLWRDTPDAKTLKQKISREEEGLPEAMGVPFQTGPVAPMDGPQHNVLNFSGSTGDMLPDDEQNGPGNMWGGPGTIPGQSRGWAASPSLGDDEDGVWKIPEGATDMKMREFFNPAPVNAEPLTDPAHDQTDEELEPEEPDEGGEQSFTGRYGGETIMLVPNPGRGVEFIMSPDKFGSARGTYGMHTDAAKPTAQDLLDKRSAWDIMQHIVAAMAARAAAPAEKTGNEETPDDQD